MDRFSVCQFFPDGTYEVVRQGVDAEAAVQAALGYSACIGAKIGTTVRVIITDADDLITFEWVRDRGVIFPPEHEGQLKYGQRAGAPA